MTHCTCYHFGECWGTKEKEPCNCYGFREKCDFYTEDELEYQDKPEPMTREEAEKNFNIKIID